MLLAFAVLLSTHLIEATSDAPGAVATEITTLPYEAVTVHIGSAGNPENYVDLTISYISADVDEPFWAWGQDAHGDANTWGLSVSQPTLEEQVITFENAPADVVVSSTAGSLTLAPIW